MTSFNVQRLDAISDALAAELKPRGFRRRGRSFNRQRDGMVDVVGLQIGIADPSGQTLPPAIRHLRPNLDGLYAVNVGIHIPEIWAIEGGGPIKGVCQDYHCHIRTRVDGDFIPLVDAEQAPERAAQHAASALGFLDRWSRQGLEDGWVDANEGMSRLTARARLDVAIMLAARGEKERARVLLLQQRDFRNNPGHPAYVESIAQKLGIPLD